ncbi:MAG: hypothetical protein RIB54_11875 [Fulvivirga sp.]|uniref:hypothetical protein n=2 Tax=Fulvivirga sp. TaxID=1931237 RepID=UPI0032F042AF
MAILTLSYKLSDFNRDPIIYMELSSHKSEILSPRLILQETSSDKKWIGKTDKKNNRFVVSLLINKWLGYRRSFIKISGVGNKETNEFKVCFNPSIYFAINYIGLPIFIFLVLFELSLGSFSYLIPIGIIVLNTIVFNHELSKSETQIESFLEDLTNASET